MSASQPVGASSIVLPQGAEPTIAAVHPGATRLVEAVDVLATVVEAPVVDDADVDDSDD